MKQKILLFLISLVLITSMVSGLVSCNKKEEANATDDETSSNGADTDAPIEEVTIDWRDYISDKTYDGEVFHVLTQSNMKGSLVLESDEIVTKYDQAVFDRLNFVEEHHDIFVEVHLAEWPPQTTFHTLCIEALSGAADYDAVIADYWYGLESSGYFQDMMQIDGFNFDRPYWISGWNDSSLVNGKRFSAVGYHNASSIGGIGAVFYNGFTVGDIGVEDAYGTDLYGMVKNGDWTIERMQEMMKLYTNDKNGDSQMNFDDEYGLGYNLWSGRAFLVGCGMRVSEINADGSVSFTLTTDANIKIYDEIYKFLHSEDCYYGGGAGSQESGKGDNSLFLQGRALFEGKTLSFASQVSKEIDRFGVLPMPKLDKDQKDYISTLIGAWPVGILTNAKDVDMSATVLETIMILGYEELRPVYYDQLQVRYQTDPKAAEMIDLIVEKCWVDFAFINTNFFDGIADLPFDMLVAENRNYVSTMNKKASQLEGWLANFYIAYGMEVTG